MYKEIISPRFFETDALGHINNTVIPVWFEKAREPVFRLFTPDLDVNNWKLIIARISADFLGEIFYGIDVEVRTGFIKIGNSSMTVRQEIWQGDECRAQGDAALIHYDYGLKKSVAIPINIRSELEKNLII